VGFIQGFNNFFESSTSELCVRESEFSKEESQAESDRVTAVIMVAITTKDFFKIFPIYNI